MGKVDFDTSPRLNGPEGPSGGEAISVSAGDGPTDDDGESEGVVPAEGRAGTRWVLLLVVGIDIMSTVEIERVSG